MKKVVVFVDDSATVLMSAEVATQDLVDKGIIDIKLFNNPLDVLEQIESGLRYDLLITDINMPQMSGFDLTTKLKSIPKLKSKPIIALTTETSNDMKAQGKKVGLVGWITKPFTNDKLLIGLKRVLRIR